MPCRTEFYPDESTSESRQWIAKHDDWDARRIAAENAAGERERVKRAAFTF